MKQPAVWKRQGGQHHLCVGTTRIALITRIRTEAGVMAYRYSARGRRATTNRLDKAKRACQRAFKATHSFNMEQTND